MKRQFCLALSIFFIAACVGCGQSSSPVASTSTPPADAPADDGAFPTPDFSQTSPLSLQSDSSVSGGRVSVGDTDDQFKAAFPRSPADSRSLEGQLPVGASAEHWTAKGWDLDNATKGVGALLYDDRVALAMVQLDGVDESYVTKEVANYQPYGLNQYVGNRKVRYWFWVRGHATLMVCAFQTGPNDLNLITALGDSDVMDRLHMSYSAAQDDAGSVDRMYSVSNGSAGASNNAG